MQGVVETCWAYLEVKSGQSTSISDRLVDSNIHQNVLGYNIDVSGWQHVSPTYPDIIWGPIYNTLNHLAINVILIFFILGRYL